MTVPPVDGPEPLPPRGGQGAEMLELLAAKVLQAHIQNRHQLMDAPPADLGDLGPEDAAMMVRAMLAAAHADGGLDPREMGRIRGALRTSKLGEADKAALEAEAAEPPCLEPLLCAAAGTKLASRFYAVSLVALGEADKVSLAYLNYLAARLDLPADLVVRYKRRFRFGL